MNRLTFTALYTQLTTVYSPDSEVQRRGRNLVVIACALSMVILTYLPIVLGRPDTWQILPILAVAIFVTLGSALLARQGYVTLAGWLLIGMVIGAVLTATGTSVAINRQLTTPFYLVIALLLAGVLLPTKQIWLVLLLCLSGMALAVGNLPADLRTSVEITPNALSIAILLVIATAVASLSAHSINQALGAAQTARREAEAANQALAASNSSLEARVAERTAALERLAAEQQAAALELQTSLQAQRDLNRVIAELSVPVMPIRDDTLVVPLVGNIDSARAEQVLASVLRRVEGGAARRVILDVTGVAIVDTQVAQVLLRVATATRLMGANVTLAGIRPEVAQALIGLGVDLHDLHTVASLQDALR
ncbi:MAG: STAS domain-containing protein [Candidatus Viridilinea halotolerans]|uniref:STAS domain-containing protein n=1 Tax=Candidatus Viridilinea halotolerans TaxID=2491704 RepID=A0A426TTK4_9CHLR|nr:MAG: STAS domain-containing protein [Candidatus Viridilinea halotolerans]